MPDARDVVIIGGGHNGLVTAFYLAKAGYKPLVLERRAQPGGVCDYGGIPSGIPLFHSCARGGATAARHRP